MLCTELKMILFLDPPLESAYIDTNVVLYRRTETIRIDAPDNSDKSIEHIVSIVQPSNRR